jgi:multidrug resistance protein, MATE family
LTSSADNPRPSNLTGEVRAILKLGVPLGIAQLATFVMGMVDTACVGRVSPEALGAVAIGNNILYASAMLGAGLCFALDPLISQAVGAGEHTKAWRWWTFGRLVGGLIGIPLALLGVVLCANLQWFGVDPSLHELTAEYALYRAPGVAMYLVFMAGRSLLQAYEDTRSVLLAAGLANLVNLVLDLILIFGDDGLIALGLPGVGLPALGVMGAGITTAFSTLTLAGTVWYRTRRFAPTADTVEVPEAPLWRPLVTIAVPIGLQVCAETWLFSLVGLLAGRISAIAVGGHQIALTLAAGSFMVALGISSATAVRVGQAVGAGRHRAVRRIGIAGIVSSAGWMSMTAIAFLAMPGSLVALFTDESEVITCATGLLSVAAAFALFDAVQVAMAGALRGAGDVRIPFVLTTLGQWGLGFPVAYYLGFHTDMGVRGLWYGLTAGLLGIAIVLSARFAHISRGAIARL